ncbi:hypothetical protein [Legionella massiliensis]|uniref:hypothetical protein n=1 Tax=Legionella massiliensis TaxID=1034943 RepID=UPI001C400AA7|nr:hypothetical protein [Legionella massiliensis]
MSLLIFGLNTSFAAANFRIAPLAGATLPSEVLLGSTVSAYYTLSNLTHSPRYGYSVVGLPPGVQQSTSDPSVSNLCTNPINLAALETCILKLTISSAVRSNFAICHGSSCTTSPQPLDVSLNSQRCDPVKGPMSLINGIEETVYNFQTDGCASAPNGNYSDVPVRPFIVGNNNSILWFASNSQGYFKTNGVPLSQGAQDILAQMVRATDTSGQCIAWLTSPGQGNVNPIESYNNELWMVVPYTLDGQTIYSLVHNEYHPCTPPSTDKDCKVSVENEYGNLVAAQSTDAGNTFKLIQSSSVNNVPVFVAPYPYPMTGIGGMFAQSNIIKWGDYYYVLIDQDLKTINSSAPPQGVCIYRTNNLANPRSWLGFDGRAYTVPLVPSYPNSSTNPATYLCKAVLPPLYRFSWSYNVVLNKFVIIGLDSQFQLPGSNSPIEAFVYTLANLDPATGVISAATNTSDNIYKEYFLREITWFDQWQDCETVNCQTTYGQAYPSVLDPNSPQISNTFGPNLMKGDRNFQYSASLPYLYYTSLFPFSQNKGQDRNVVRQALKVQNCIP